MNLTLTCCRESADQANGSTANGRLEDQGKNSDIDQGCESRPLHLLFLQQIPLHELLKGNLQSGVFKHPILPPVHNAACPEYTFSSLRQKEDTSATISSRDPLESDPLTFTGATGSSLESSPRLRGDAEPFETPRYDAYLRAKNGSGTGKPLD